LLQLIAGEQLADDAALASHVGSCLRCFRTASEMRDLPRIAALLRQAEPGESAGGGIDPGPAFWARFPGAVTAAWVERRATAGHPVTAGWGRLVLWLRSPIGAALAGAAVTALVMLVVAGSHRPGPDGPGAASGPLADGTADEEMVPAAVPDLIEDEDPWALLEMADLRSAMAQAAVPDDAGDGAPTAAEEVEQLDMDDLPVVAQALRGHSRI
jgi:hypothetical protein